MLQAFHVENLLCCKIHCFYLPTGYLDLNAVLRNLK